MFRRALAPLFASILALMFACGDDGPGPLEIDIRVENPRIAADGSELATLLVTALHRDGSAAELGTSITVTCVDDSGGTNAAVGSSNEAFGSIQTDTVGRADVSVRCAGEPDENSTIFCTLISGDARATSAPITCVAVEE
jgi:hypothetical protein